MCNTGGRFVTGRLLAAAANADAVAEASVPVDAFTAPEDCVNGVDYIIIRTVASWCGAVGPRSQSLLLLQAL